MPVLDVSAETLRANPKQRVEVNGYTDAIGSEAYNLLLAKLRAQAVVAYLESKGISAGDSAGLRQNQLCGDQQDCRRQGAKS